MGGGGGEGLADENWRSNFSTVVRIYTTTRKKIFKILVGLAFLKKNIAICKSNRYKLCYKKKQHVLAKFTFINKNI